MHKSFIFCGLTAALMCWTNPAHADQSVHIGIGSDIGVPSGLAIGGVICDYDKCGLRTELALTYNTIAFGGRLSFKLDPLALNNNNLIGVLFDIQGGLTGQGHIPGHSDLPSVGYQYLNFYGGLRLGKAKNFHWNFEVGPTYFHAAANNFQSFTNKNGTNNVTVSDPGIKGWLVPTFITGFEVLL